MEYISCYRDVENQGSNSMKCTGVALSQAIEISLYTILNSKNVPDISSQFIYYNSKLADEKPYTRGTPLYIAVRQLVKYGACEEKFCEFNSSDGDLISTMVKPTKEAYENAKKYKPIKEHRIDRNVESIKNAILKYGSVVTSLVYGQGMMSPTDGYIKKPSTIARVYGSHATCWIGFSDKHKCFIQLNSYGKSQGRNGIEYIPYDCLNDDWYIGRDEANRVFQYCYAIEFDKSIIKNPNYHLEHQPKEVIATEPELTIEMKMGSNNVLINGVENKMDISPVCINGTNLVPFRFIFEVLGYNVNFIKEKDGHHSIVAKSRYTGRLIQMNIGYEVMYNNGNQVVANVAPMIYKNFTLVPLRTISEMSGCKVNFDNKTKTIIIKR